MFQPLTLRGKQLDQLDLSARTAGVAHWCILSSPDAVVPHLIGPGAGSPRWVVPPLRGVGFAPARHVCERTWPVAAPCGCTGPAAPQRTA